MAEATELTVIEFDAEYKIVADHANGSALFIEPEPKEDEDVEPITLEELRAILVKPPKVDLSPRKRAYDWTEEHGWIFVHGDDGERVVTGRTDDGRVAYNLVQPRVFDSFTERSAFEESWARLAERAGVTLDQTEEEWWAEWKEEPALTYEQFRALGTPLDE